MHPGGAVAGVPLSKREVDVARGLDRQPLPEVVSMPSPMAHENLRGPGYYAAEATRREVGQC